MTFRFLRGAVGDEGLLEEHRDTIHRILKDDYTEKNIEKLQGHEVYSMKLGDAKRLLFSIIEINLKKYLLVLDYLPTHDYHKSRFLQSGVLAQYKEKMSEATPFEFEEIDNFDAFADLEFHEEQEEVAIDFYQDKWITLNSIQNDILRVKLPAVVNGSAGSGKSCVALSLLASQVQEQSLDEETPKRLLYVSQNRALVQKMQEAWLALPAAVRQEETQGARENVIEFKTFDDLIPSTQKVADAQQFSSWFDAQKDKLKHKVRDSIFLNIDKETLYEEFRICSGYKPEQYIALGERQSLIPRGTPRKELLEALTAYKAYLSRLGLVDIKLHLFEFEPSYTMVVVDESQDFSHAQIVNLTQLAQRQQIICFMDSHQRLFDRLSIRPFLLDLLQIHKESPSHIQLEGSYRCPPRIMGVANQVIHFKHQLVQGIADKFEATTIHSQLLDSLGAVHLIEEGILPSITWIREQGTQLAIVTSEENKARASGLFGTPLVFSPAEIKGLEYPIILAWELFDSHFFKHAYRRWQEVKDKKAVTGRSVEDKDDSFIALLNAIFTAYTRAEQRLIICEKRTRENNILLGLLSPLLQELPQSLEKVRTSILQWEDELKRQVLQGNHEQAQRIFITKLGRLEQDYAAYTEDLIASTRAVAKPETAAPKPAAAEVSIPKPQASPSKPIAAVAKPAEREVTASARRLTPTTEQPKDKYQVCAELTKKCFDKRGLEFLMKNKDSDIPFILLNNYFTDETFPKKYSLMEWLLQDSTRTQSLIRESLNHVGLFVSLALVNLKSITPASNLLFNQYLKFQTIFFETHKKTLKKSPNNSILLHIIECSKSLAADLTKYIELGGDINHPNNHFTAALLAAQKGRVDIIQTLHRLDADLDSICEKDGVTPLYLAVQHGHIEVVKELHRLGADVNKTCTKHDLPPIFIAVQNGNLDMISMLWSLGANQNYTSACGQNLAHIATQHNQVSTLSLLHSFKVNLDQEDMDGITPLHIAACKGYIKIIKILRSIDYVDFNKVSKETKSAVYYAAEAGNSEILQELYARGANLNFANENGFTPAIIATISGHLNVLSELHRLKVDLTLGNSFGEGPIHFATKMENIQLIRKLHQFGVNVNQKSRDGIAAIHLAAELKNINMIEELHKLGANIDQVTKLGNAAIHIAADNNDIRVIKKLHSLGANLNKTNGIGSTPALIASEKGHKEALAAIWECVPELNLSRFFKPASPRTNHGPKSPSP